MFKHILFPSDGSEQSQKAARQVVSLAKSLGARITAFHINPPHPVNFYVDGAAFPFPSPSHFDEIDAEETRHVLGYVEALCLSTGVECAKLSLTCDVVHDAIIDVADKHGCDLICMASHGRRGLSALLLGSETTKVLTHSNIPVLVLR